MKKRIIALLLCIVMIASVVPFASANHETIKGYISFGLPEVPYNSQKGYGYVANAEKFCVTVGASVLVKKSGEADTEYRAGRDLGVIDPLNASNYPVCDWKAKIDMTNVRNAFELLWTKCKTVVDASPSDEELQYAYNNLALAGEFSIKMEYPAWVELPAAFTTGTNMYGFNEAAKAVYEEVGTRSFQNGVGTIKVKVKTSPKLYGKDIYESLNTKLCDLELTCEGIKIKQHGTATLGGCIGVSVEGVRDFAQNPTVSNAQALAGYTDITLDDEVLATILYRSNTASAAVSVSKRGGGGGIPISIMNVLNYNVPYVTIAPKSSSTEFTIKGSELPVPAGPDVPLDEKFAGWFYDAECTKPIGANDTISVSGSVTVYGKWEKDKDYNALLFNVPFANISKRDGESKFVIKGKDLPDPTSNVEFTLPEGVTFGGWFYDAEYTQPIGEDDDVDVSGVVQIYGKWINTKVPDALTNEWDKDTHFAYVIGYPDGNVRPLNSITRAEVATIFYRLLNTQVRDSIFTDENSFTDSPKSMWSNKAVSSMAKGNYVTGYPNGSFRPNGAITRAEFVTMAGRFENWDMPEISTPTFNDISGHWAEKYIEKGVVLGWITGYSDGSFKPDQFITRAEAMTIYNRVLNRHAKEGSLIDTAKFWPDNPESAWYYYEVEEATNFHKYDRQKDGIYETWTEITTNQVWIDKPHYEDPEPT